MIEGIRGIIKVIMWTVIAIAAVVLTIYTVMAVRAILGFDQNFETVVRKGSQDQKKRAREIHKDRKESANARWIVMHYKRVTLAVELAKMAGLVLATETKEVQ